MDSIYTERDGPGVGFNASSVPTNETTMLRDALQDTDTQEPETQGINTPRASTQWHPLEAPEGKKSIEKDFWNSGRLAVSHERRLYWTKGMAGLKTTKCEIARCSGKRCTSFLKTDQILFKHNYNGSSSHYLTFLASYVH